MVTRLKRLREEQGYTVSEFCRKAGLWSTDYYCIAAGTRKVGRRKALQIAEALGVEPGDIFNRSGWALGTEEIVGR